MTVWASTERARTHACRAVELEGAMPHRQERRRAPWRIVTATTTRAGGGPTGAHAQRRPLTWRRRLWQTEQGAWQRVKGSVDGRGSRWLAGDRAGAAKAAACCKGAERA
eukprot:1745814-Prymnesium_polylepis.1